MERIQRVVRLTAVKTGFFFFKLSQEVKIWHVGLVKVLEMCILGTSLCMIKIQYVWFFFFDLIVQAKKSHHRYDRFHGFSRLPPCCTQKSTPFIPTPCLWNSSYHRTHSAFDNVRPPGRRSSLLCFTRHHPKEKVFFSRFPSDFLVTCPKYAKRGFSNKTRPDQLSYFVDDLNVGSSH